MPLNHKDLTEDTTIFEPTPESASLLRALLKQLRPDIRNTLLGSSYIQKTISKTASEEERTRAQKQFGEEYEEFLARSVISPTPAVKLQSNYEQSLIESNRMFGDFLADKTPEEIQQLADEWLAKKG